VEIAIAMFPESRVQKWEGRRGKMFDQSHNASTAGERRYEAGKECVVKRSFCAVHLVTAVTMSIEQPVSRCTRFLFVWHHAWAPNKDQEQNISFILLHGTEFSLRR
jgi:hypothetical protein